MAYFALCVGAEHSIRANLKAAVIGVGQNLPPFLGFEVIFGSPLLTHSFGLASKQRRGQGNIEELVGNRPEGAVVPEFQVLSNYG